MKRLILLLAAGVGGAAGAAEIPDRPEKLTFPALNYEPPAAAGYRVALKAGPVAILVPNRELPLVGISITVRTGKYVEPSGKDGLAAMTGALMDEGGAGARTAEELEERLAFLAASLGVSVGETEGTAGINLLSKDLDEGLSLLRDVLSAPRFQESRVELHKQQSLQAMKQRNDDSRGIEGRERLNLAYGEKFWRNRQPTKASIESITRADLAAFHRDWFHPANFVVSVQGDFDRTAMTGKLEKFFSNWPFVGKKAPPIPDKKDMAKAGLYLVDKDVNQGRVSLILPGIHRDNPDYFPIQVMNEILGSGGFTSRIVNRVRSDEGLAYSAGSIFPGATYYEASFVASFQSKSATVAYAASLVLEEMKRISEEKVTAQELETAKRSFIETFPSTFDTPAQVAGALASEEFTGRARTDPDYYKNYRAKVSAVTAADVQRVARKYLTLERVVILAVGNKADLLKGHPNHAARLDKLVPGPITTIPLRDPLTMQPLPQPSAP